MAVRPYLSADAVDEAAVLARARLEVVRDELVDRTSATREQVRERLDSVDLDPAVTRAQVGFWTTLRALGGGLAALPGLVSRVARAVGAARDELTDQGQRLTERGREVVAGIPPSRRQRRRQRVRSVGLIALGTALGVVIGWVLAARRQRADEAVTTHLDVDPALVAAPALPTVPPHTPGDAPRDAPSAVAVSTPGVADAPGDPT
jgi:hypothetical protein